MRSESMVTLGYVLAVIGAIMIIGSGVFFYSYMQDLISASASSTGSSTSTTSVTQALGILNGTANSPIIVGLTIFGISFLLMGTIFVVGGYITENLAGRAAPPATRPMESFGPRAMPMRACMKCGTLLYQVTPYCPSCGSPLGQVQAPPAPTA